MTEKKQKPIVEVKPHSYQPSRAEMEEVIDFKNPDGSKPSPEELATYLLNPVTVVCK